jgi:hypothetical protein
VTIEKYRVTSHVEEQPLLVNILKFCTNRRADKNQSNWEAQMLCVVDINPRLKSSLFGYNSVNNKLRVMGGHCVGAAPGHRP